MPILIMTCMIRDFITQIRFTIDDAKEASGSAKMICLNSVKGRNIQTSNKTFIDLLTI